MTSIAYPKTLLPAELVEEIIQDAWSSDVSNAERTSLFTSFCLVNHTFLNLFIRIAFIDVHIFSPSFAAKYLNLLHERSPAIQERDDNFFLSSASHTLNRLCRSITFHVDNHTSRCIPDSNDTINILLNKHNKDKTADAISDVLYMIDNLSYTPNLRRVSVEYFDWGFGDIFEERRLLPLPPQVNTLEVKFTFSKKMTTLAESLRITYRTYCQALLCSSATWKIPNVKTLRIEGAPAALVDVFTQTCPQLEVLEVRGIGLPDYLMLANEMPESLRVMDFQVQRTGRKHTDIEDTEGELVVGSIDWFPMRRWFENLSLKRKMILSAEPPSRTRVKDDVVTRARKVFNVEVVSY